MKKALKKLQDNNIQQMSDLDRYESKKVDRCNSRYNKLKAIVGEKQADSIMQELMVRSW